MLSDPMIGNDFAVSLLCELVNFSSTHSRDKAHEQQVTASPQAAMEPQTPQKKRKGKSIKHLTSGQVHLHTMVCSLTLVEHSLINITLNIESNTG